MNYRSNRWLPIVWKLFAPSILIGISGCADISSVRRAKKCLDVGVNIENVSSCIKRSGEYEEARNAKFHWNWIEEYCADPAMRNCSTDLPSRLTKSNHSGAELVAESTLLFRAKSGNLGGPFVMLYVFYGGDQAVIGWSNMGAKLYDWDFQEQQQN